MSTNGDDAAGNTGGSPHEEKSAVGSPQQRGDDNVMTTSGTSPIPDIEEPVEATGTNDPVESATATPANKQSTSR